MTGSSWLGIALLLAGVLFLFGALLLFYLQFVFDRRPEKVGKTFGYRRGAKQKDNVILWGGRTTKSLFIRHLTKASYRYTVNEKEYRIRHEQIGTKKETPRTVPILYWKRFPCFAYISISFSSPMFSLWACVVLFWAVLSCWLGIALLLR